jgi:transposase, IS5 family
VKEANHDRRQLQWGAPSTTKPAKLAHKDRDARSTVKFGKAREHRRLEARSRHCHPDVRYQNHVSIDCEYGLIRRWDATNAAAY